MTTWYYVFPAKNDIGFGALNVALRENLVLVVVLVLESKALSLLKSPPLAGYFIHKQETKQKQNKWTENFCA